ncbi:MAG TPA: winged helix-turn-helix transcriptional regulator [Candidatus Thermoplasmatota archaeon]|nr:winged helix-turn-helix transcriptional regulator [Candidatus Thermoplasmatota archaeon]
MLGRGLVLLLMVLAPAASASDDAAGAAALDTVGAVLSGVASAASATVSAGGHAAASAGSGIADALGAVFATLGGAAVAVGAGIAAAAAFVGSALSGLVRLVAALASGAASLLTGAFRWGAANPRDAATLTGAVGGAAAATGLALWLRRVGATALLVPFLPLYSRLAPEDVLANAARAGVFEHIRGNPGAHPRAIAQTLGLGWGTTVYHLGRLEERGLVSSMRRGGMRCYFAAGTTPVADRLALAAVKHPTALSIAEFVRAHPHARQKDVAEALGLSAALVSWHVGRLEEAGVLAKARDGKATALVATPAAA